MHRTVIAGGPRTGKTTLGGSLARSWGVELRSTDDLIGALDWDASIARVVEWMSAPGPWVIEGVTAVRALRAWLSANDEGTPCDTVYWSNSAKVDWTRGQRTMAKGCATVWRQVEASLRARGVNLQRF